MNEDETCMLKEITNFLIKVGEHCLKCESKSMKPQKPVLKEPDTTKTDIKSTVEIQAGHTYMVPTKGTPKKKYKHGIKQSYLEKWIQTIPYDVFTLDQFYKAYPKQRKNRKLSSIISRLIVEKKIIQLGKNKFKVV